jgi:hypothetical protein
MVGESVVTGQPSDIRSQGTAEQRGDFQERMTYLHESVKTYSLQIKEAQKNIRTLLVSGTKTDEEKTALVQDTLA